MNRNVFFLSFRALMVYAIEKTAQEMVNVFNVSKDEHDFQRSFSILLEELRKENKKRVYVEHSECLVDSKGFPDFRELREIVKKDYNRAIFKVYFSNSSRIMKNK